MLTRQNLEELINGLTSEQLVDLMHKLLADLSEEERKSLAGRLEPDVATVFKAAFEELPADSDEVGSFISDAKFAEHFQSVLERLHMVIFELGYEEGDYVAKEHDWEPPDFDTFEFTNDIEECTEDLLPLLDRAAELNLADKDLFFKICDEITEGLESYPEYIYTEEGVSFEKTATECVLKWTDLQSEDEADFLSSLNDFMQAAGMVELDKNTILENILEQWDRRRRKKLYEAIENLCAVDDTFGQQTNTPHTVWHELRYSLADEFDPANRLAIAEETLEKDWTKGSGLINSAVADGNTERALEFCHKTVSSYYRQRSFSRDAVEFVPGKTLLPGYAYSSDHNTEGKIANILLQWAKLARDKGNIKLAELLDIHEVMLTQPDNWDRVKEVFEKAESADTSTLFTAWRNHTLGGQTRNTMFSVSGDTAEWPAWLLDAGWEENFSQFEEKILTWLRKKWQPEKKVNGIGRYPSPPPVSSQLTLAADLFALDNAPQQYDKLKTELAKECKLCDCPGRLAWLQKADTEKLTKAVLDFMRANLSDIIPSPENMTGNYSHAAAWLAVAREVAPAEAQSILWNWQYTFKRKRNLWRDLRAEGFDV